MGKHLEVMNWYDKTSTGTLRRKRVSAAKEVQFPLKYRKLYQQKGLPALVTAIRAESNCSLAAAWEQIKRMFNSK